MNSKRFIPLILAAFFMTACAEILSDEYCSDPDQTCPDNSAIDASACCTNEDCYWVYNGTHYDCDGEDCDDAIDAIVTSACVSQSAIIDINETDFEVLKSQMQAVTAQLLIEARGASGCVD